LAPLALQNKRLIYNLLFHASAATLLEIARDPRHLGAEIGFFSVLHTWDQRLRSTDISYRLRNREPSPCGYGYCSATTGSSTPSALSAGQNTHCAISVPTPTASPFPTAGWLLSPRTT